MIIRPVKSIKGTLRPPADKSISHRGIMIGSIGEGRTHITNFLNSEDCRSTIRIMRALGVPIKINGSKVTVAGCGLTGLAKPRARLDAGNSGTTMRIVAGILSAQAFDAVLTGDASLRRRPMNRLIDPLRKMGAQITCRDPRKGYAPLYIKPCAGLKKIHFDNAHHSAQVKSAVLLAGVCARSSVSVTEKIASRDHTERMLRAFGARFKSRGNKITLLPPARLCGRRIDVPADISSAAFLIVAATILPGSDILLKNVGINPTRTGIIDIMKTMGAKITLKNRRRRAAEPVADIRVRAAALKGTSIGKKIIPRCIDELPAIMVAACFAKGKTRISAASELRVKETDRIASMHYNLRQMGADFKVSGAQVIINGGNSQLKPSNRLKSFGDHRTAMCAIIAALACDRPSRIDETRSIGISYPGFIRDLERLKSH